MTRRASFLLAGGLVALSACAKEPSTTPKVAAVQLGTAVPSASSARIATSKTVTPAQPALASLPKVVMHASPTCGCCGGWAEHMRKAGFAVAINRTNDLGAIKERLGVPLSKGSCHTAEVGSLLVEGHVPAEDIKRLLSANDGSRGLVLPGMPGGSPGMELPDGRVQRYTVEKVNADGSTQPFAVHGEQ